MESWHHKKPVVAFNVPALCEIIEDEKNGLLVTPFSTEELSAKIIRMFNDTGFTRQMGEQGFEKLQQEYSLERMTDEMIDVYNHL